MLSLKTLLIVSTKFYRGDTFCWFLVAFLHTNPILKRGLLLKERICSQGFFPEHQALSNWVNSKRKEFAPKGSKFFKSRPIQKGSKNKLIDSLASLKVYPFSIILIVTFFCLFQFCMLCSAGFHMFGCHSEKASRRWLAVDLGGILIGVIGCYLPAVHYAFYCLSVSILVQSDCTCFDM